MLTPDGVHYFGYNKDANGQPPTPDSLFEIGSITKVFTSLALADLVLESGAVALASPVNDILPNYTLPTYNGQQIQLVQLASHMSGLPRQPNNMDPQNPLNPYSDYTGEELREFLESY